MTVKRDGITFVDDVGGGGPTTNVNITEVNGAPTSLGQKTSANSFPVVIASDQSPVPVTGISGGGPATIANGADVNAGATTDVAVTSDINATLSGKLRGLVKIFSDVWDSVNHLLKVSVNNSVAVTGTFFQATQPVSGPLTDAQLRATPVPISGAVTTDAFAQLESVAENYGGTGTSAAPWNNHAIMVGGVGSANVTQMLKFAINPQVDIDRIDSGYQDAFVRAMGGHRDGGTFQFGNKAGFLPGGGFFDDVNSSTLSNATEGMLRLTSKRAQHVNLRDNNGVEVAPLTDTQLRATAVPVSVSAGSAVIGHVITDSGSVVAATLSAETTKVIGTINIAASQTVGLVTGTAEIGNVKNSGTFAVQAALNAETTKVIGTINVAAGQTIAVTNAGTFAVQAALNAETTKVIGTINIASGQIVQANAGTNLNTSLLSLESTQLIVKSNQTDRSQFTKVTDGTRDGTVKAASTLPLLTDTAFVTTQRDPLPAGTNAIGTTIAQSTSRSDTFTTTGNGVAVTATANPFKAYALQVVGTGAPASTWDVRLEGSLDGVNFDQILQHTNTTGDGKVVFSGSLLAPSLYFRSRVAGLILGLATNIVVTVVGIQ